MRICKPSSNSQGGFTLIEALIAFLILTIGLLGASIFHSSLLRDTSETRSTLGANSVAEAEIERVRKAVALLAETDDVATAIASSISSSAVASGNQSYDVALKTSPVAVSGARSLHQYTLVVSWPAGEADQESIELSSYIGWSNQSTEEESGVDLSEAASGYEGSIPVPTGTLTALERKVLSAASLAAGSIVEDASNDDYTVYRLPTSGETDDLIVGVKIGDDFVQLAQLNAEQNELFSITGRILNDTAYPVENKFGCTYSGATDFSTGICDSSIPDEDVLDIAGTGGVGCIIYSFTNDNLVGGAEEEAVTGDYLCIAGTGWNGQLAPRILDIANPGATDTQESIDGLVCSPELRGYKYVIVEPENPEAFATAVSNAISADDKRDLLNATSVAVAGQSGLVRFYQDDDPAKTDEGVYWGSYFWHNPDYLVEPSTANFSYTVYDSEIENFSGDIAYQNFFMFAPPTGNPKRTCANYGVSGDSRYTTVVAGSGGYDALESKGLPGWDYTPSGYDAEMFNTVQLSVEEGDDQDKGVLILGYTLAKFSVKGTLFIDSASTLDSTDFEMGGNPEPVVSILCNISDTVDDNSVTGYDGYSYSCGIPTSWTGAIYAHPTTYPTDLDRCIAEKNEDGSSPDEVPGLSDVEADAGVTYPTYYKYWTEVLSGSGEATLDFSELSITRYESVNETKEDQDFYFTAGTASCP